MFFLIGVVQLHSQVNDLLEQSLILAEFCRKVNIPYRVYLFSDAITLDERTETTMETDGKLIEIMSNEMNNRQHKEMMTYLGCHLCKLLRNNISLEKLSKEQTHTMSSLKVETIDNDGRYWDLETRFTQKL